jgi:hypothetical protein
MKTQSKTEIKNSSTKVTRLLQGIDNDALSISKSQEKLNKQVASVKSKVAEAKTLVNNIAASAAAATTTPSATKPAKAAKTPAKVAPVKAAKPAKVAKPAKAAKAAPVKKEAAKGGDDRPPVVDVINTVLSKATEPLTAAKIYSQGVELVGYFSRQALYTALKKSTYIKTGDGASATFKLGGRVTSKTSDEEAEAFVEKSSANTSTSAVV